MGEKVIYYNFRSKDTHGWRLMTKTKTKTKTILPQFDTYYNTFLGGKTHRKSCYNCVYSNVKRVADITMADFWDVDIYHPEFYDKRGVSIILISTEKGLDVFRSIEDGFEVVETAVENAPIAVGRQIKPNDARLKAREIIYRDIRDLNVEIFSDKSLKLSIYDIMVYLYRAIPLPFAIKRRIKKAYMKNVSK